MSPTVKTIQQGFKNKCCVPSTTMWLLSSKLILAFMNTPSSFVPLLITLHLYSPGRRWFATVTAVYAVPFGLVSEMEEWLSKSVSFNVHFTDVVGKPSMAHVKTAASDWAKRSITSMFSFT